MNHTRKSVDATSIPRVDHSRSIEQLINGQPTQDGAGVKLNRLLTQNLQQRLDPFLMLDNFGSDDPNDYIAGFPNHPHRGFETVTFMIEGQMRHRDSHGGEGLLQNGGVQWMHAGYGLIHSELPEQTEGRMEGFQLWLNLPRSNKLDDAWYEDLQPDKIPTIATDNGATVSIIAGEFADQTGAMTRPITEPLYLDISLAANSVLEVPIKASHNAFITPYRGQALIGDEAIQTGQMAILANDEHADGVTLKAGDTPLRCILVAGKPLREPIVQYGPFVMNNEREIHQAIADYQAGKLGQQPN